MASWHSRDSIEEESSSEVEKIFAENYMEVLQESYCSSDDDIDEEVHSKENILVTRIFFRHVNLVPRVPRLFGQRGGARRDSGIMEKYHFFDWSSA